MSDNNGNITRRQTLALILWPMVITVVSVRLYLHSVEIQHLYIAGHIFYHLFTGVLLVIPAAFIIAFQPRTKAVASLARIILGCGSALVLDEVVFLVATGRTAEDYVTILSLGGSLVLNSLAAVSLFALYRLKGE